MSAQKSKQTQAPNKLSQEEARTLSVASMQKVNEDTYRETQHFIERLLKSQQIRLPLHPPALRRAISPIYFNQDPLQTGAVYGTRSYLTDARFLQINDVFPHGHTYLPNEFTSGNEPDYYDNPYALYTAFAGTRPESEVMQIEGAIWKDDPDLVGGGVGTALILEDPPPHISIFHFMVWSEKIGCRRLCTHK